MKAYALKSHIRELGCELYRIGRSRNWQLKADHHQVFDIIDFIEQADEESWRWLVTLLKKQSEAFTHEDLISIAQRNTEITVNELLSKTDCTIAQARRVIDEIEWLDE